MDLEEKEHSSKFELAPPPVMPMIDISEIPETPHLKTEEKRENTRGYLACGLLGLLFLEVTVVLLGLMMQWLSIENTKEVLGIILPPTVGLLGAVTGFYYGGNSKN